jgi:hypothetical protein
MTAFQIKYYYILKGVTVPIVNDNMINHNISVHTIIIIYYFLNCVDLALHACRCWLSIGTHHQNRKLETLIILYTWHWTEKFIVYHSIYLILINGTWSAIPIWSSLQNCISISHVKNRWINSICNQTFSEAISIFEKGLIPI